MLWVGRTMPWLALWVWQWGCDAAPYTGCPTEGRSRGWGTGVQPRPQVLFAGCMGVMGGQEPSVGFALGSPCPARGGVGGRGSLILPLVQDATSSGRPCFVPNDGWGPWQTECGAEGWVGAG